MELAETISTLPYEAVLNFTYRCNLSCPFCYQQPERARRQEELPSSRWFAFIDELAAMQVFTVTVSGGEPFSHPLCCSLLERITANRMRFKLLTNGTLIGPDEVAFLVSLKRCAQIQLSIDGFEPEHDAIRGNNAFRKTLDALKLLTDAGLPVVTNTVVTRENFRSMVKFARFLETLPIKHYRLTPYSECCGEGVSLKMLTPEELADLVADLEFHREEMPHAFRKNRPFSILTDIREKAGIDGFAICSNTFCSFGVRPDGSIVPCPDAPGPVMGYIGEKPFREIWNDAPFRAFRSQALAGAERNDPACRDCLYTYSCRKFCYLARDEYYCRKKMAELLRKRGVKC